MEANSLKQLSWEPKNDSKVMNGTAWDRLKDLCVPVLRSEPQHS